MALAALAAVLLSALASSALATLPFRIECVDAATGRGVPLIQLTTSGYISYYSDSAGIVAFDEPGLLGRPVYFMVRADGYVNAHQLECSNKRACAQPGALLKTTPGGNATIYVNRTQPAERLHRLTGGGLYRDSVLVGDTPPIAEPLLSSASVLGQDSLMAVVYKNRSRWFFGTPYPSVSPLIFLHFKTRLGIHSKQNKRSGRTHGYVTPLLHHFTQAQLPLTCQATLSVRRARETPTASPTGSSRRARRPCSACLAIPRPP